MAEKDKKNKSSDKNEAASSTNKKTGLGTWIIVLTIVIALSGSGFFLGRLLADSLPKDKTSEPQAENTHEETLPETVDLKATGDTWYYNDLESVVVNPDEPGATRFVRVGLILEIGNALSQEKATSMIKNKNPLLINWLNLYFKSLSLDQMENERDMKRILSQICDGFNDILFPESKPFIKSVLIREFNIQ